MSLTQDEKLDRAAAILSASSNPQVAALGARIGVEYKDAKACAEVIGFNTMRVEGLEPADMEQALIEMLAAEESADEYFLTKAAARAIEFSKLPLSNVNRVVTAAINDLKHIGGWMYFGQNTRVGDRFRKVMLSKLDFNDPDQTRIGAEILLTVQLPHNFREYREHSNPVMAQAANQAGRKRIAFMSVIRSFRFKAVKGVANNVAV